MCRDPLQCPATGDEEFESQMPGFGAPSWNALHLYTGGLLQDKFRMHRANDIPARMESRFSPVLPTHDVTPDHRVYNPRKCAGVTRQLLFCTGGMSSQVDSMWESSRVAYDLLWGSPPIASRAAVAEMLQRPFEHTAAIRLDSRAQSSSESW
jgi:hypothetical protein